MRSGEPALSEVEGDLLFLRHPFNLRYTRASSGNITAHEVTYGILQFLRRTSHCGHKVLQ